ncbi:MAG: extracellular solute-binding protein [Planctomycetota bacterium]
MTLLLAAIGGCVPSSDGDVVAYVALDREFARPILAGFTRGTEANVKVNAKYDIESTKTVGLVSDIIAEADQPIADVFWNNEVLHTIRLQKAGLLQSRRWDVPASYPRDMMASDGTWCGFAARARVLIINSDILPDPKTWPRSVEDLADERWAGRCGMARPLFGTTATHFAVIAAERGLDDAEKFLDRIVENATILPGNKQVAISVSAGQLAWGLTDTDDAIIEKDQKYPVAIVFPDQQSGQEGAMRIPNTVMVLKNAPHPRSAAALCDYLVTPAIEDRLAMGDSSQIPLHREAKFPPRVLPPESVRWKKVDFEKAADTWDPWVKRIADKFE